MNTYLVKQCAAISIATTASMDSTYKTDGYFVYSDWLVSVVTYTISRGITSGGNHTFAAAEGFPFLRHDAKLMD